MNPEAFPLQWPIGRNRTDNYARKGDPFHVPSGKVRTDLFRELKLMKVTDFTISSNLAIRNDGLPYANQRTPDDPGVALYFKRKGQDVCISCDQYRSIDANLRAISNTIKAMRGIERWGTEEMLDRAFTGFKALPESIITPPPNREPRQWFEVLGVRPDATAQEVKQAYREQQALTHPDAGGTQGEFEEVQQAYQYWKSL